VAYFQFYCIFRWALFATWMLVQLCMFQTKINVLAPIIAQFYLLSYGAINFAYFFQRIVGVVNFRPSYTVHHPLVSLAGFALCVATMLICDAVWAVFAIATLCTVALAIVWVDTEHPDWGDLSQAVMYHQIRKCLLRLKEHHVKAKYWRPQVLVLLKVDNASSALALLALGGALKKGGMYQASTVLVSGDGEDGDDFDRTREQAREVDQALEKFMRAGVIKGFPCAVVARSVFEGTRCLLQSVGLGQMRPNIIIFGFPSRTTISR
jgi:potassium/chloride transporter 9